MIVSDTLVFPFLSGEKTCERVGSLNEISLFFLVSSVVSKTGFDIMASGLTSSKGRIGLDVRTSNLTSSEISYVMMSLLMCLPLEEEVSFSLLLDTVFL